MDSMDSWARGYEAGYQDKLNKFLVELEDMILNSKVVDNNGKIEVFRLINEVRHGKTAV